MAGPFLANSMQAADRFRYWLNSPPASAKREWSSMTSTPGRTPRFPSTTRFPRSTITTFFVEFAHQPTMHCNFPFRTSLFRCWRCRAAALFSTTPRICKAIADKIWNTISEGILKTISNVAFLTRASSIRFRSIRPALGNPTSITIWHFRLERRKRSRAAATAITISPFFYDEPRLPEKRLNVADLQQLLQADRGEHDRELARILNSLELTERLSTGQLAVWKDHLHGKEAKAALTALGDESVFLAPPTAEIPKQPEPDGNMQQLIIERAEKYLDQVLPM